jgi:hypothetical protein
MDILNRYQEGKQYFAELYLSGQIPICSKGFVTGGCSDGHKYANNVLCGKEFCSDCGRDGSPIHCTRFLRWWPKADNFNSLGYYVVTIPECIREYYKSKIRLSEFRTAIKNKFKELGYTSGLMRWHLFGSCKSCGGKNCKECNYTGAGKNFNPHLNILIEGGYIENLEADKNFSALKNFIKSYFKRKNNYTDYVVLNYSYASKTENKINFVKYITRSTFRIYDFELAKIFFNYRMTSTFGNFKEVNQEQKIQSIEHKLENNICIICSKAIKWNKLTKITEIQNPLKHLTNGKFKIEPRTDEPPGRRGVDSKQKGNFRKRSPRLIWRTSVAENLRE